jgi:integrase
VSQPDNYTIGRYRGKFAILFKDANGKQRRHTLGTSDPDQAKKLAPRFYAELTRPRGKHVAALWEAYKVDKGPERRIVQNMEWSWKALKDRFGNLPGDQIPITDSRAHTAARRKKGIKDGTIRTELNHLRIVLNWSAKHGLITKASPLELPPAPKAKEDYYTQVQIKKLIANAIQPHIKLYILLAWTTCARNEAILDLTWDRCNFTGRGEIDLRNPAITRPHKGRAIIKMNEEVKAALLGAKKGALSDHVIEWSGKSVKSVKKGLHAAASRAGLPHISPHMIRHSGAVCLVESGHSMEEIAQYLGHSDVNVTRKIYARYSPDYLRGLAESLSLGLNSDV